MINKTIGAVLSLSAVLIMSGCASDVGDNRASLEDAVDNGIQEDWIAKAQQHAEQTVSPKPLSQLQAELLPHENVYLPDDETAAPYPTLVFLHGCSGSTTSHEEDWAERFNGLGVAVISVDSYSGRDIDWNDACNFQKMTPWERSGDIVATIESLSERDEFDEDNVYLAGFSHGAGTIWTFLRQLSDEKAPLSLASWPETDYEAVIDGAFMFYGTCRGQWSVDIDSQMFLGSDDRYIDEAECVNYSHPKDAGDFEYVVYPGATHTFDHAEPNPANVEAGSIYDEQATLDAWQRIKAMIEGDGNAK
ncbi:MAG: dienelactone hydrolase family protein [Idiomarinaceae bacterium]|uniref:dienelactone hydrolase family protein n=1 Tax=Idiomarina sp. 28-8 TaxID=1260624 RepID=UPI000315A858|nr:dienelactone hydrolase family protein [Idiomarina sp. 28-8]NWO01529.1 dienelactone hydrolase family protein [Idiomarinaceae bacterium]